MCIYIYIYIRMYIYIYTYVLCHTYKCRQCLLSTSNYEKEHPSLSSVSFRGRRSPAGGRSMPVSTAAHSPERPLKQIQPPCSASSISCIKQSYIVIVSGTDGGATWCILYIFVSVALEPHRLKRSGLAPQDSPHLAVTAFGRRPPAGLSDMLFLYMLSILSKFVQVVARRNRV